MKSEKGQSLVEFALVVPLLILLLFGIIDFARIFHVYLTMDHAGREAARAASIGNDDTSIRTTAVNDAASIGLTADKVAISSGSRASGSNVTITITYPITFLTPVIGNIVGSITLTDSTTMRVE
ncbi:TadE/TadG family type IV pilus assembly protein [Paenibacillus sp. BSR1-1]|uniref:TadE/TadG family type IV pilus assembly protein n=1 Tax=Paenibacillus sp. BSR1-1 TaxID=3020845 RepID=UPI0025B06278|nr:TadE/TadG family type IV pilus assembly protein [Paenibacillus sp. BSR1-1]MDN3019727.1 TadE/TadG family type IV pilus assembly protein [Paenibacillus sp. BSR1-1]